MTGRGYHVTDQDIKAFDLQKGGSASGASPGRQGIWLLEEPDLDAQAFFAAGKANPSTYPLVYRPGRSGVIALDGSEMNHEISATLDLARQQGYDSVILKNYTAHGGKPQAVRVIFDPSNIRSVHAAFDPEKSTSSTLLAAAPFAALGGAGLTMAGEDARNPRTVGKPKPKPKPLTVEELRKMLALLQKTTGEQG